MTTTKEKVLAFIQEAYPEPISGQLICDKLIISRTAVWKAIQSLKEEGYDIHSQGKSGYYFTQPPVSKVAISAQLNTKIIGKHLTVFPTISSTNTVAKQLADVTPIDGNVLIAEEQIGARGRLGRTWNSTKGKSVALSITLTPSISPTNASLITQIVAAAFVLASEPILPVKIKWPNDIVVNGQKLCGILTEMSAELTEIHYVVVGIGINTNLDITDFSDELQKKATSFALQLGQKIDPNQLISAFLNQFEHLYQEFIETGSTEKFLTICREHSAVIGKDIHVISSKETRQAQAITIDNAGQLIVKFKGDTESTPLLAGEISIRGLNGYI
ncbi:biotin--[acetyl-CoA-carboxylase] ligase [Carnobacterium maltaromaticum]|uniref:biotin--[acetyl-CoA-carboxylase] ligase n=1 Tax=Carnobacterium maltaromaticum TaxID=2751 RepID=UPI00026C85FE|nr:biotin--[acetyl-CoA-carboxylase] ligase [Carnobacterium maltaromaticum]